MAVRRGERALHVLADRLRSEESVISPHVRETNAAAALGALVAAGQRASAEPGEYALVIESIREGYLLHYGEPRVVVGVDPDLALLAGDYLYARGLERLARLGDLDSVRELSDLISLCAQIHAERNPAGAGDVLWLASAVAVAAGGSEEHEIAKEALRRRHPDGPSLLLAGARSGAARSGLTDSLGVAAESVGFDLRHDSPDLG